ncbi:MAG: hypothetical protein KBF78_06145 [Fuscovulum sp.]|jgi:preprotein translocase subunit SecD|nr:hypothetical protein [Fuscovulum sp.]
MRLTLAALALMAGAAGAETPLVSVIAGTDAVHARAGDVDLAEATLDLSGNPALRVRLDPRLDATFARLTSAHVGEVIRILICGQVRSEPMLLTEISRAEFMVAGVTSAEARDLAARLTADNCDSVPAG